MSRYLELVFAEDKLGKELKVANAAWVAQNKKTNRIFEELLFVKSQRYLARKELDEAVIEMKNLKSAHNKIINKLWEKHNLFREAKNKEIASLTGHGISNRKYLIIQEITADTEETKKQVSKLIQQNVRFTQELSEKVVLYKKVYEDAEKRYLDKDEEFRTNDALRAKMYDRFKELQSEYKKVSYALKNYKNTPP